ncbi:MAG: trigger factor [Longimicrobiales bacterium]|nr:trigger factor [Longimicrobiales bacterium]
MAIEASILSIDIEERAAWRRALKVTVPAEVVAAERRKITARVARQVKLPGFRAGHTPASVVEKRFGTAVNRELVDQMVSDAYQAALDQVEERPISEGEVEDITWQPDEDLRFEISFDVRPDIELTRLSGFKVERPSSEVGEDELQRVIERLREEHGAWRPVEEGRPEAGDLVSITATQLKGGEPDEEPQEYDLTLGRGDAIEDVESALHTLAVGESGDFTVTFPDDFPNEARRGESQELRLEIRARKVRDLPEVDDAFAASLGDFESFDALRSRIREDLEKEAASQAESIVRGQLLDAIIDANPFDVPISMVERYLNQVLGEGEGADPERFRQARESVRGEAERAVRRMMVIERVATHESLRATDDQIDARVQEIADANDTTPARVYAQLQQEGALERIEHEITERQVFDWLLQHSEVVPASS